RLTASVNRGSEYVRGSGRGGAGSKPAAPACPSRLPLRLLLRSPYSLALSLERSTRARSRRGSGSRLTHREGRMDVIRSAHVDPPIHAIRPIDPVRSN